ETDLAFLGGLTRLAFTGSVAVDDDKFPEDIPYPLRWLNGRIDRTGDLIKRIRTGTAPELATAAHFGSLIELLTPRPAEPPIDYLERIEANVRADHQPGVIGALYDWAKDQPDPVVRLSAARLAARVLPLTDVP